MSDDAAWKRAPNFLSLCLITLLAANYFGTFADLDYTWQVRTGGHIVHSGELRTPEMFSYTIAGKSLPDFEWLYEVVLWLFWTGFGFGGLRLLKVVCVAAPLVILSWRLRSDRVGWYGIAISLFVALIVLAPGWNLRPLTCSTICLLLVFGWLHEHCTGQRPLSWWLPVTMLLWANLHPGVIMGQGLLAGAIAWEWINRGVKLNAPLDSPALRRLTLIGGLGLAATFVSPDPVERLLYPFHPDLKHPIFRIFTEMQPLYTFLGRAPHGVLLAYLVTGLVALLIVLRFRQYRLWEVALFVGLAGLANVAYRSLQDWLLVSLALGVPHLAAIFQQLRERCLAVEQQFQASSTQVPAAPAAFLAVDRSLEHTLNSPAFRFQWTWPAAAMALLAVVSLVPPVGRRLPSPDMADWPNGAATWIDANGLEGRFFGPPDYGAYLVWRLGNRAKSYVDTRGFFFPPELIEDSHYVPQLGPDWRNRMDRVLGYGTDYFLVETTGARGKLWQALEAHVGEPLYRDDRTVLLTASQVRAGLRALDGSTAVSSLSPNSVPLVTGSP